jgi:serine protease AprX
MKYWYLNILLLISLLVPSAGLNAQKRYWVFLADKSGVEFDPYSYFDSATIYNRQVKQIPLVQFSDLPLREDYLNEIKQIAGNLGTASRWINAVAVKADNNALKKISKLPFVTDIQEIKLVTAETGEDIDNVINFENDQLRESQINEFGVKYFENLGIDGSGVRIAVFDGGFPGVDTSSMFKHLRDSGRIIATWDFVKNKENVYDYSSHGTSVLTCIAGILDNKKFGLAPGAEFLLARTEISREVFSEEENWLAAVEWADKNGADIISSSLGYTFKRYFPNEMDGKSTLVTRSANMAASKGILVINAAGNDGDKKWEVIGAPADADSVLSIGGISPDNGYHIDFSSFGPTFDGRMKPNLVAFGKVSSSNEKRIKQVYGTSFSTPLVAGFAACVMQIHPEWSNMETFRELEKSGHLFPYFDYAHGYGVPQASYFTVGKPAIKPSFLFSKDDEKMIIAPVKDESEDYSVSDLNSIEAFEGIEIPLMDNISDLNYQESEGQDTASLHENATYEGYADPGVEYLTDSEIEFYNLPVEGYELDRSLLYFKIIPEGEEKIKRYAVVNMQFSDEFTIPFKDLENGDKILVYYKGYVSSYIFNGM